MKILLILLILTVPVQAQDDWWKMEGDKKKSGKSASSATAKPVSPTGDIKERIKTFRNGSRFSVQYDKFKDETWIRVGPFVVGGDMRRFMTGKQLYMSAQFRRAPTGESVQHFSLWFQATGKRWEFLKSREMYAIIDGERFSFGEGRYDGDVGSYAGVSESLGFLLTSDVFEKLGKASKVELRIGSIELILKDEHREAFRDLLSLASK